MDGDGVSPNPVAASSFLQRKKRASTDAQRESALSAKAERGRVKCIHRQNTLVYYASSRNRENTMPLETARNAPHPISVDSDDLVGASAAPPPAPMEHLDAVAASLGESSNARHGGPANCIIVSSTSEDGGAETPTDLQEVSILGSDESFDEDGEGGNP